MSFRSVDFPAPLGPTNAILVSRSKPKSRSLYIKGCNKKKRKIMMQWKLVCQRKFYIIQVKYKFDNKMKSQKNTTEQL
jgi:hypothetical protein